MWKWLVNSGRSDDCISSRRLLLIIASVYNRNLIWGALELTPSIRKITVMSGFEEKKPNPLLGGAVPLSEISEEEDALLDELLEKIQTADSGIDYATFGDYLSKPNALIRFLRARRLNVDKAFAMLRPHVEWLQQIKPAEINIQDISKSMRSGCWRLICDSKNSNPTILVDLSRWNPHEYTVEEYVRMIAFFQCNVFTGKKEGVHQFCVVFDMEGWAMWHATYVSYIKELISLVQNHFPERLLHVFILNAPYIFQGIWAIISPLIDSKTRAKIEFIYDTNRMAELFEASELPEKLGGTYSARYPVPNLIGQPNLKEKDPFKEGEESEEEAEAVVDGGGEGGEKAA